MNIQLKMVPVRDVVSGYKDDKEEGVYGYNGKLNIRPKYQREFVYNEKQRDAVIRTVKNGFPLNTMYWMKNEDGTFEVLDGQQRTISICQYVNGDFSLDYKYFYNLTDTEKNEILDYELMIYICEGTDKERLDWFYTINIAGEKLTDQEIRNAVYTGAWLTDAKRYFSKTNCPAYQMANKYIKGSPIRQDYLETVLEWISAINEDTIREYMALHQHDATAVALWNYFSSVISWVKSTFVVYRPQMKSVKWGLLYNDYGNKTDLDPQAIESEVQKLMLDVDVTNKAGIYPYIFTKDERSLSVRAFDDRMKQTAYERQNGICPMCGKHFKIEEMHADHITPWSKGGKTIDSNCQMLCADCNRKKSNI